MTFCLHARAAVVPSQQTDVQVRATPRPSSGIHKRQPTKGTGVLRVVPEKAGSQFRPACRIKKPPMGFAVGRFSRRAARNAAMTHVRNPP
jgi:hypothetical protein